MKKVLGLILFFLAVLPSYAQVVSNPSTPDCQIGPIIATATGRSAAYDNRGLNGGGACTTWTLIYFGNVSARSIEIDGAPDNNGAPGAWTALPTISGAIGNPSILGPQSQLSVYTFTPWVSVNINAMTPSLTYIAMGMRSRLSADSNEPYPGLTTSGAVDGYGNVISQFGFGGQQEYPYLFNGTSWDRQNKCPTTVPVSVGAAATVQIVAPGASKKIYICDFLYVESVAGTVQLIEGTGATCGTGTTNVTGAITGIIGTPIGVAGSSSTFQTNVAGDGLCVVNGAATVGAGFASVAQY